MKDLASENALSLLTDIPAPILVIDAHSGRLLFQNKAASSHYGFTPLDSLRSLLTQSSESEPCLLERISGIEGPATCQHEIKLDGQGPVVVQVHGFPVLDKKNNICQLVAYIVDISQVNSLESELSSIKDM